MKRAAAFGFVLTGGLAASVLLAMTRIAPPEAPHIAATLVLGWSVVLLCGPRTGPWPALVLGTLATLAVLGLLLSFPRLAIFPFLLIGVGFAGVSTLFARGLGPQGQPILLRLIEIMARRAPDDPAFVRFIRGQCLLWAALCASTSLLALLSVAASARFAGPLTALMLGQIAWFILSHEYARWRYGRPETFWTTLRTMLDPATWPILFAR